MAKGLPLLQATLDRFNNPYLFQGITSQSLLRWEMKDTEAGRHRVQIVSSLGRLNPPVRARTSQVRITTRAARATDMMIVILLEALVQTIDIAAPHHSSLEAPIYIVQLTAVNGPIHTIPLHLDILLERALLLGVTVSYHKSRRHRRLSVHLKLYRPSYIHRINNPSSSRLMTDETDG